MDLIEIEKINQRLSDILKKLDNQIEANQNTNIYPQSTMNQSVGSVFINDNILIPSEYPKFDRSRIKGTNIFLADDAIIYPETSNTKLDMVKNISTHTDIKDKDFSKPIKKTPFLEVSNISRIFKQDLKNSIGVRDPRDMTNDTPMTPGGLVQIDINNTTYELEPRINNLQESLKTVTNTPYGPIRQNESEKIRTDIKSMYSIQGNILDIIGLDSRGILKYTDGNSFIERCIFTGYHNSFKPSTSWKPSQQFQRYVENFEIPSKSDLKVVGRWVDGEIPIDSNSNRSNFSFIVTSAPNQQIPVVFVSKSGYYYTRRPPIKSMFLGYNDQNIVPNSAVFWEKPISKKINFYNDRICENELQYSMKTWFELRGGRQMFRTNFDKEYILKEKESCLYGTPNKKTNTPMGSHRRLLESLSKSDIILNKTLDDGTITPYLKRRIEHYGPNPIQHIFYMDYFNWRKYTTTYIPEDELSIDFFGFKKPVDSLISNEPFNKNRSILVDNFINGGNRGRFYFDLIGDTWFFQDSTYIIDIYFGLMEMHLKSFSWKDIFSIVDRLPELDSSWTNPNWDNLSYGQKSEIRFKELDEKLEPIWNLIKQVIDSVSE